MRSIDRIAARAVETNTLFGVLLELTYRCNLDCFFCYNDLSKRGTPVSTERYLALLEELQGMGVLNLTLSGGEPLAHPGFWIIARRASALSFAVRVKTNGHSVDATVARKLLDEVAPFMVEVSLHGATPATHDRQTRVPGSFDRLMANLQAMKDVGLHVKLNSTLTSWNAGETEGMFDLADSLGMLLSVDTTVSPRDDGNREPMEIAPSVDDIVRLRRVVEKRYAAPSLATGMDPIDEVPQEPRTGSLPRKNCGVGSSTLAIDPYGDVFPCVQWRRPVGNIHGKLLADVWHGNPRLAEIRSLSVEAARMVDSQGVSGRFLAFCPALAEQHTGSPLGLYPSALARAEAFSRPVEIPESGSENPLFPIELPACEPRPLMDSLASTS